MFTTWDAAVTSEAEEPVDPTTNDSLIDIAAVAERLGVTPRFVRRLVADRRIPYYKVGHYVRFDRADVERWLQDQRRQASSAA